MITLIVSVRSNAVNFDLRRFLFIISLFLESFDEHTKE